jgi:hypothetical protein
MKRFLLVLLLSLLSPLPLRADAASELQGANDALSSGHPIDAVTRYQALAANPTFQKTGSPELWYNLGLAQEKTDDLPGATLSFRRSLLLDPGFAPARKKLNAVLTTLGLPLPSGRMENLAAAIHPEILILAGSAVGWAGVIVVILVAFLAPRRKLLIGLALTVAILGHGAAILGTFSDPRRTAADKAVVTARKAPVLRATPADAGQPGGTLERGSFVSVLSRNGAWWYVSGGPGLTGWILSDTVTPLLPGSPSGGS